MCEACERRRAKNELGFLSLFLSHPAPPSCHCCVIAVSIPGKEDVKERKKKGGEEKDCAPAVSSVFFMPVIGVQMVVRALRFAVLLRWKGKKGVDIDFVIGAHGVA